jgi:hypothetical protein
VSTDSCTDTLTTDLRAAGSDGASSNVTISAQIEQISWPSPLRICSRAMTSTTASLATFKPRVRGDEAKPALSLGSSSAGILPSFEGGGAPSSASRCRSTTYTHTHTHMNTHTHVYIYTYTYTYTCIYICVFMYMHVCNIHIYIYILHTYIHT